MKKILSIISIVVLVILVSGCSLIPEQTNNVVVEKPLVGNCNVFECIKKLNTTDDLETVTKVMGFDGNLINEGTGYKTYKWIINGDKNEAVQAVFYTSSTSISITFSDDSIKDSNVDFSNYDDIKKALNNKETLKYKDFTSKFKGEGTLIEKTSTSNKYRWVNEKNRYINATFNSNTGACTMVFGMV